MYVNKFMNWYFLLAVLTLVSQASESVNGMTKVQKNLVVMGGEWEFTLDKDLYLYFKISQQESGEEAKVTYDSNLKRGKDHKISV